MVLDKSALFVRACDGDLRVNQRNRSGHLVVSDSMPAIDVIAVFLSLSVLANVVKLLSSPF